MVLAKLKIDISELLEQTERFSVALQKLPQPLLDCDRDLVLDYLDGLESDVVLCQNVGATRTDGPIEILYSLRLGSGFEGLLVALGATKSDGGPSVV
ncbi:hypothetical protein ICN48_05610 [Polynucleobacter sp. JS-Safj-400b-B2]|uniref:hypothetical protein n=1 Tax=Polynucleobacter sp. JS-Safj-400b-B2 TaxID=2576921 RepID=UPI001C0D7223|nr:hypothetical protein [Polynucleobacter sp. JS-Safj-400b-B2]MBU3625710.1 hypothetical protein [Polynucleobacter sp. JS-Safj-400b-B2]